MRDASSTGQYEREMEDKGADCEKTILSIKKTNLQLVLSVVSLTVAEE